MKKFYFIICFSFLTSFFYAQNFGNEWINYNQKYFYFPITKSGIHKLDFNLLNNSGIALSSIKTENFQLFGRDKEQPLYIVDGGDSYLDSGDYILFYADKNDGWLDSTLYEDSTWIGNPGYSLYNDTINYFLSWNNSQTNLRFVETFDSDFNSYVPLNFILQKVEASYNDFYNQGANRTSYLSSSFFMPGEGFGLTEVNGTNGYTQNLTASTKSPYLGTDAPAPIFHGLSTTNYNSDYTGTGNHHTRWTIGSSNYSLYDQILFGYQFINVNQTFPISELNNGNTTLKWSIIADQGATRDVQSLNYWSIIYPKTPTLSGANSGDFIVLNDDNQSKIRLDLSSANFNNPIMFVFGDTPQKPLLTSNNGGYSALFQNSTSNSGQRVIIQNTNNVTSVSQISPVNSSGYFTNLSNLSLIFLFLKKLHQSLSL